jgi:hypothetical protein
VAARRCQGDGGRCFAVQVSRRRVCVSLLLRVMRLISGSCDQEIIRRATHAALNDAGVSGACDGPRMPACITRVLFRLLC